ncbi:dnaJ-like protein 60 isoform X1 [Belonocnema kinseyi]|uniref:dnaJ-like protein 60 isoform X1 n=1 Tax=Belonocnema kinseyi TaxID=2817044 RepID=UPI00143E09D8|nr:dnaJ-like protein 60 isoform X1 [Belonocnema kinseyi]
MNQIFRSCKLEIYMLSRCYGNQGKKGTHYETLGIPENSSQKEIRQAFIKLSKELHPDIKGKESHSEYVKINEAYNVLGKENLRRVYDANIKYGNNLDQFSSYSSHPTYETVRRGSNDYDFYTRSSKYTADQWDEYVHSQAGDNYYGIKGIKRVKNVFIILMICSFVTMVIFGQIIVMNRRVLRNREIIMARSIQYQSEYKQAQRAAEAKSREEQIQDLETKIDLQKKSMPLDGIN